MFFQKGHNEEIKASLPDTAQREAEVNECRLLEEAERDDEREELEAWELFWLGDVVVEATGADVMLELDAWFGWDIAAAAVAVSDDDCDDDVGSGGKGADVADVEIDVVVAVCIELVIDDNEDGVG